MLFTWGKKVQIVLNDDAENDDAESFFILGKIYFFSTLNVELEQTL